MNVENVLIVGAGAIGGYLAAAIAEKSKASSARLTVLATERSASAIANEGLTVVIGDRTVNARPKVITEVPQTNSFGLIIVATKSHRATDVLIRLAPLAEQGATILTAMNGVPWWFAADSPELGPEPIRAVDRDGSLLRSLPLRSVIAAVADFACRRTGPGVIAHSFGRKLTFGGVDPSAPDRAHCISSLLSGPLIECEIACDIRTAMWSKLINNASMNPISLLTEATLADMCGSDYGRRLVKRAMVEVQRIGEALGLGPFEDIDARIDSRAAFGSVKTSMLQDWEGNQSLEIDSILTAVIELGTRAGVRAPTLRALLELSMLKSEVRYSSHLVV